MKQDSASNYKPRGRVHTSPSNKLITMNKTYIEIGLVTGRRQYLTEILPDAVIPSNTILYKKLTGLGATYGEIKANRNSVIIEPNKPVIVGKCKDPKHSDDNLFAVHDGVYTDDIVLYMVQSKKQGKNLKILTTPESFYKVRNAFEEMEMDIRFECFLLFDECHKIIKDSGFRPHVSLPMDLFFECEQKALVSATPIDFTDVRFRDFTTIEIVPTFDYVKGLRIIATNNLLQTAKKILLQEERCFIFCNSTDMIYCLMKQLDVLDKSAVFCSEKSVDKLKCVKFNNASDVWDMSKMKQYNWLTSRFYNAVDIELEFKPNVVLISDCYLADYTIFDPHTDAVQCVGRFRNGVGNISLVTNTNPRFDIRSKEELMGTVKCLREDYERVKSFYTYATTNSARDAYKALLECSPYKELLDEQGRTCYYKTDYYINFHWVKGFFNNPGYLVEQYSQCGMFHITTDEEVYVLGEEERLMRTNPQMQIKEKRKVIIEQLGLICPCQTEMDYHLLQDLEKADEFIVKAYLKIGKSEIEKLNYNSKKINEAMIMADYNEKARGNEVQKLMANSFSVGQWYSASYIKSEMLRIFGLVGLKPKKAITSNTITDFFEAEKKEHKKKKGYLLVRSRIL